MLRLSTGQGIGFAVALQVASPVFARATALEHDLPPPETSTEFWPWLVAGVVLLVIGSSMLSMFKTTAAKQRHVDSFEAWAKTESELAPRAHTSARLPSRDAVHTPVRRATRGDDKAPTAPAAPFGRRSV